MENQHQKITGYRELTQDEIDLMNKIKAVGKTVEDLVTQLEKLRLLDQRWISIGRTHMQQGLMALVRSVAKPTSF